MKGFLVMSLVNSLMVLIYLVLLVRYVFRRLYARLRGWFAPGDA